ncbi:single-strand binding protein [Thermosinus carboxydivorans Nor1]|uniref:Single-stranded DNA-binding protein n=1 Tax=Thermosinus carboxydivorans Nor1 TaxID=401526 RepID=A1HR42_9FIRM|nr:single-stranded DNA-binding protein [Thermosinus carboxydivorans]EAX47542.1 single-strand binding protein [Thermosinus carboxydivorans Nor1]
MNKAILVGRLAQDPDVRYTQSGKAVASFNLAVNRYVGQGQQQADFIPIVAWDKLAETVGNYLAKGQRILVEGRLQVRSYEKDGAKRWVTEVVALHVEFLEQKKQAQPHQEDPFGAMGQELPPDEEIPF